MSDDHVPVSGPRRPAVMILESTPTGADMDWLRHRWEDARLRSTILLPPLPPNATDWEVRQVPAVPWQPDAAPKAPRPARRGFRLKLARLCRALGGRLVELGDRLGVS